MEALYETEAIDPTESSYPKYRFADPQPDNLEKCGKCGSENTSLIFRWIREEGSDIKVYRCMCNNCRKASSEHRSRDLAISVWNNKWKKT